MRDAAGKLAERFHFLRARELGLRLLQRFLSVAALGDDHRKPVVELSHRRPFLERGQILRAGGKIVNGPMEVPGGDWIAQGIDPQGAMFAVSVSTIMAATSSGISRAYSGRTLESLASRAGPPERRVRARA